MGWKKAINGKRQVQLSIPLTTGSGGPENFTGEALVQQWALTIQILSLKDYSVLTMSTPISEMSEGSHVIPSGPTMGQERILVTLCGNHQHMHG